MKGLSLFFSKRNFKSWFSSFLAPLLVTALLLIPSQPSEAASGGRIGGGSFRSPSMPRTGGYGGGYRGGYGGGGYRGGYGGGYRGGGIGFPFIFPFFFGGGGLFGFFILMAIIGTLMNALRGVNGGSSSATNSGAIIRNQPSEVTLVQVQVGLLAKAKALQDDLRQLAATADTSNSAGLQRVLQDTTLALLRQPDLWAYINVENGKVPFNSAEATFNRLSITERSKLTKELTTNVSGEINNSENSKAISGEADQTNEFIVVTIVIASTAELNIKSNETGEHLSETLRLIGSISSSELIALEVIWQPDGEGDVLSSEKLVTTYPNLKHL